MKTNYFISGALLANFFCILGGYLKWDIVYTTMGALLIPIIVAGIKDCIRKGPIDKVGEKPIDIYFTILGCAFVAFANYWMWLVFHL